VRHWWWQFCEVRQSKLRAVGDLLAIGPYRPHLHQHIDQGLKSLRRLHSPCHVKAHALCDDFSSTSSLRSQTECIAIIIRYPVYQQVIPEKLLTHTRSNNRFVWLSQDFFSMRNMKPDWLSMDTIMSTLYYQSKGKPSCTTGTSYLLPRLCSWMNCREPI